jgi:hypothetical protein
LKNLIFICLALIAMWQFLNRDKNPSDIEKVVPTVVETPVSNRVVNTIKFKCDGRQHCSDMRSYGEAKFFIQNCPNTKMDGDGDGIPCESQFGY